MTSTNQNKDIHWFNLNAVLHRVTENDLSDSKPSKFITDMESVDFLPSHDDNLAFLTDLIPLAARVISDKIPAFEKFKSCYTSYSSQVFRCYGKGVRSGTHTTSVLKLC